MKNTKNNNSKVSKDFSARDVGVLLESVKNDIGIIAEQHGDIIKKLEDHDKKFDILAKNHLEIVDKLEEHDARFETINKRFDSIDKKLDTGYIKQEEFVALEERVATLEK